MIETYTSYTYLKKHKNTMTKFTALRKQTKIFNYIVSVIKPTISHFLKPLVTGKNLVIKAHALQVILARTFTRIHFRANGRRILPFSRQLQALPLHDPVVVHVRFGRILDKIVAGKVEDHARRKSRYVLVCQLNISMAIIRN